MVNTQEKPGNTAISADFPYESKFVEVKGSRMHYIEAGSGDPILFLHGNPTSSYLWRNVIPYLEGQGRCIAPDLIGMGKSGKPDIEYGFTDTFEYLEAFIETLGLKNITLVLHDWGSGMGFHYANTHRDNIKAIAFMEAMIKTYDWSDFDGQVRVMLKMVRSPAGWLLVKFANVFIKKMLPDLIVRDLTAEEKAVYAAPYPTIKSRTPLLAWPRSIPIAGSPPHVHAAVSGYIQWLTETDVPKLLLYNDHGVGIRPEDVQWVRNNMSNIELVKFGSGTHFIQEDSPHELGRAIAAWHAKL